MAMKERIYFIIICILSFSPWLVSSQILNTQVEAKIEISSNGEFYKITGFSTNRTDSNRSLRYVLSVIKSNVEGKVVSKNDQQGRFILEPNQKKELSSTSINVEDDDRTIILLLIYDEEDVALGKDRIVLKDFDVEEKEQKAILDKNKISEDISHAGADGIVLRGIVVENTKTKPGRDFYQKYALEYMKLNINGERIVTINEVLAMGSNTKIELKIGDDVVVQFFLNPRSDYIEQMVDYSIKQTNRYFYKLRNNRNTIRKF